MLRTFTLINIALQIADEAFRVELRIGLVRLTTGGGDRPMVETVAASNVHYGGNGVLPTSFR